MYKFTLLSLFLLSFLFFLFSLHRKKYIGIVDFSYIFSTFFIFFRPAFNDFCSDYINRNLYYWDSDHYVFGTLFSAVALNVFYLGYILSFRGLRSICLNPPVNALKESGFVNYVERLNILFFITYVLLIAFAIFFIRSAVGGGSVSSGAVSVRVSGFEFVWPFVRMVLFFSVFLSIILFFLKKKAIYFLQFLLIVAIATFLGRRGMIVAPVVFSVFVISVGYISFSKRLIRAFNFKVLSVCFLMIFILFNAKNFVYYLYGHSNVDISVSSDSIPAVCSIVKKGHQEFDLLWPAVIEETSVENFLLMPKAFLGNFIPHGARLDGDASYYSSTDRLMMKYQRDAYRYEKFGISPNLHQFLFLYFGFFSLLLILFLGRLSFSFEKKMLASVGEARFFRMCFLSIFIGFITSPWDVTLKYFLFNCFVLFLFFSVACFFVRRPGIRRCG